MLQNRMLAWGVSEGRIASEQKPIWLLDELIEQGDQWIINGAPKSGKSLVATQLALAIASGGQFLNWRNRNPARVLYMDFELRRVRISTLHNETEKFSLLNSNAYKGAFLCLVTYSHLP
ncbi:AAA family ATPase [Aeromonas caviae]|uniref:AAA family ATPase n=1 Tax=Aeromonas caviae TaxID=648 RepID=UPI002B487476|nr:AAA family ATPase [Aeromonas caviae]